MQAFFFKKVFKLLFCTCYANLTLLFICTILSPIRICLKLYTLSPGFKKKKVKEKIDKCKYVVFTWKRLSLRSTYHSRNPPAGSWVLRRTIPGQETILEPEHSTLTYCGYKKLAKKSLHVIVKYGTVTRS